MYQTLQEYNSKNEYLAITVSPSYDGGNSQPAHNLYTFSYQVNFENISEVTVKLINRHWQIFSGGRKIGDVKGSGVIGKQPELAPREVFQYTSCVTTDNSVGQLRGCYTFINQQSEFFDFDLPAIDLLYIEDPHLN